MATLANAQISLPDLSKPPNKPILFGGDAISTSLNERDFALSPDGTELYFTVSLPKFTLQTIVFCQKKKDGNWSPPEVVSFSGRYSDLEPTFSADGNTLYFASNRPVSGDKLKDFDIWKVTRAGQAWGEPVNLGPVINSASNEFYPSVAKNGNIYFTATYDKGVGLEDIYLSEWKDGTYLSPVVLDTTINSKGYEFNAYVSPNEDYIIFTSYGRKDDLGGGDLYMSTKSKGKWMTAKHLTGLNSPQLDYCPYVSPDGKILFFTSERHQLPNSNSKEKATYQSIKEMTNFILNGSGNIYWVDFDVVKNSSQ